MLVQFTLKNFLSFKEETVIDMRAINSYKEHQYNLIENENKEKFVKVASIYGANASGKSNLYFAMMFFRRLIDESNNTLDNDRPVLSSYYMPFRFDDQEEDSMLEAIIEKDGYQFVYGFEYNASNITGEWAYRRSLQTNRQSVLLERDYDEISFGATARKDCNKYRDEIPTETLALTFFSKWKKKNQFHDVYEAIESFMVMPQALLDDSAFVNTFLPGIIDDDKVRFVSFLSALDTGIRDIRYTEEGKETYFLTTHLGEDGNNYELNLYDESDGTIRCIAIYINIEMAIRTGCTLVIDELNLRLHPLLVKYIVNLFYRSKSEAQLIYTTHDVTLLRKEFFRRDQIWLVDKDEFGHSALTALSDYKLRSDASFDKDYLGGVYGGIPRFDRFSFDEDE